MIKKIGRNPRKLRTTICLKNSQSCQESQITKLSHNSRRNQQTVSMHEKSKKISNRSFRGPNWSRHENKRRLASSGIPHPAFSKSRCFHFTLISWFSRASCRISMPHFSLTRGIDTFMAPRFVSEREERARTKAGLAGRAWNRVRGMKPFQAS